MRLYIGQQVTENRPPDAEKALRQGIAVDAVIGYAMEQASLFIGTQVEFKHEGLRLWGTPDCTIDWAGETLVGELKSTGPAWWHYRNPEWDLAGAYFWRQLQAYLLLAEAEKGVLIIYHRDGGADLRKRFCVRRFYRDDTTIAGILTDLAMMHARLDDRVAGEGGLDERRGVGDNGADGSGL